MRNTCIVPHNLSSFPFWPGTLSPAMILYPYFPVNIEKSTCEDPEFDCDLTDQTFICSWGNFDTPWTYQNLCPNCSKHDFLLTFTDWLTSVTLFLISSWICLIRTSCILGSFSLCHVVRPVTFEWFLDLTNLAVIRLGCVEWNWVKIFFNHRKFLI